MKKLLVVLCATVFVFGVVKLANALPVEIYSNNFESSIGSEWSDTQINYSPILGNYHGDYYLSQGSTLTLTGIQPHTQLSLEFDLYLFYTWDGNDTYYGPDWFGLDGDIDMEWTFTNHQPEGQSYPGSPDEIYGSGSTSTHVYRGLDPTGFGDEFLISHTDQTFNVAFTGPTTQSDEWWGIDNVRVTVNSVPEPATCLLLLFGFTGLLGLKKKFS
ncbi:MAG: PEP-CTERM sorting domain-containing protein [bacterium]